MISKKLYSALLAAFFVSLTNQLTTYVIGLHFASLNSSLLGAGLHLSIFSLFVLLARTALLHGRFLQRPRTQLLAGAACTALACIGFFFSDNSVVVTQCRALQGVGFGLASSGASALVTSASNGKLLANVSLYGMVCALSSFAGPVIALQLYWRTADGFSWVALLALMCTISAFICGTLSVAPANTAKLSTVASPLKIGVRMAVALTLYCLLMAFGNGYMSSLPLLTAQTGMTNGASVFIFAAAVVGILFRFIFPTLARPLSMSQLLSLAGLGYGGGILFILLGKSIAAFFVGGALIGIFGAVTMLVFHWAILQLAVPEQREQANLAYLYAIDISMIGTGALWAGLVNSTDVTRAFATSGIAVAVLCIVSAIVYRSSPRVR